jgi:hypothetical protein
VLVEGLALL